MNACRQQQGVEEPLYYSSSGGETAPKPEPERCLLGALFREFAIVSTPFPAPAFPGKQLGARATALPQRPEDGALWSWEGAGLEEGANKPPAWASGGSAKTQAKGLEPAPVCQAVAHPACTS